MDYTVNQLAKLAGVTVRTLRFYDEIGLLKPAFIAENGYRYYREKELLILQQILFFRELGFELKQIQEILGQSDFDQLKTLQSHKNVLRKNIERIKTLLITIDKTINHLEGKQTMSEKEIFFGLQDYSPKYQKFYRDFIKSHPSMEKFYDELYEKTKHLTEVDKDILKEDEKTFWKNFVRAFAKGLKADSSEIQQFMKQYVILGERGGVSITRELLMQMAARMSTMSENHTKAVKKWPELATKQPLIIKVLDSNPGLGEFLADAMKVYAARNLS